MAVLHQMIKGAPRSVLLHNPRSKARYKTVICSLLERINSVSIRYRSTRQLAKHDDVIKWKHFPRYWPFVRGIHRSLVNPLHKGQWRGALMFSIICAWINRWVYNRAAGDLRRHRAHYDVIVMFQCCLGKKKIHDGTCAGVTTLSFLEYRWSCAAVIQISNWVRIIVILNTTQ